MFTKHFCLHIHTDILTIGLVIFISRVLAALDADHADDVLAELECCKKMLAVP